MSCLCSGHLDSPGGGGAAMCVSASGTLSLPPSSVLHAEQIEDQGVSVKRTNLSSGIKNEKASQAWWHTPVIPTFIPKAGGFRFKASLGFTESSW